MKKITNNDKGFSLVELIVVIAIIGVVSALATVSFASTAKRGRDSRRMADLEKIRIGLEMHKQALGTYPADLASLTPTYMQQPAQDPKSPNYKYYFAQTNSGYGYDLRAAMEDSSMANMGTPAGDCGLTCNYQVTNP